MGSLTRRDAVLILLLGAALMHLFVRHHTTVTVPAQPSSPLDLAVQLPATSLVAHAPGWTLFRNLYMSNGTLFIHTLEAWNTPENIRAREPGPYTMALVSSSEAQRRWGDDVRNGRKNRVWSVDGNTVLVNEPRQFLRHYYHFVAELFFGVQAFWHGAFSPPSLHPDRQYALGPHLPPPPPITRVIFAHATPDGWHDGPGFNAYFMRAAFPATAIEVEGDWRDRVTLTAAGDRAWHFPLVLLTDRSAAFRGEICGGQTQRIAAEAVAAMQRKKQLVDGWWESVRSAVLRFAGADVQLPDNILITYISRQSAAQRKLTAESHEGLVQALRALVNRKGEKWELVVMEAEKLSKDEQFKIMARTTVNLLGVHGNGLTHLIFYPQGFAHDYQWTTHALGMKHFAVWNDTFRTAGLGEGKPDVAYPAGFQGNYIPLIEDRVEGRV
ncbi:hypothetical protein B0H13DRAFT_2254454 [Mycena leptocephala]|nr:hypothetical protein B0H13DRAFT_2254454 [Mycena leptocephala]